MTGARKIAALAFFGMIACATARTEAAITTFFGQDFVNGNPLSGRPNSTTARNSFQSNLVGVSTENFDSFATGASLPLVLTFGSDTATLSGSGSINGAPETGAFATSGTKYLRTSSSAGSFVVNFNAPQAAFGFFATDVGDIGSQITLTLSGGSTQSFVIPSPVNAQNGSILFFGIIGTTTADTFTRITFTPSNNGSTDVFGFDDLTIGRLSQVSPVPEPASIVMVASCLPLALAWRRLRRRPAAL